jgi:hypothetical protein
MSLKNKYETLEHYFEDSKIIYERNKKLEGRLFDKFPENISAFVNFEEIGKSCIRAFIFPDGEDDENARFTSEEFDILSEWLVNNFDGKLERNFREDKGTFMYRLKEEKTDDYGEYRVLIFIEQVNVTDCKIIKKEVTRIEYKPECVEASA